VAQDHDNKNANKPVAKTRLNNEIAYRFDNHPPARRKGQPQRDDGAAQLHRRQDHRANEVVQGRIEP